MTSLSPSLSSPCQFVQPTEKEGGGGGGCMLGLKIALKILK